MIRRLAVNRADESGIKDGSKVMIVDAGGGTVDLSTYTFVTKSPLTVEEVSTPDCQFSPIIYSSHSDVAPQVF